MPIKNVVMVQSPVTIDTKIPTKAIQIPVIIHHINPNNIDFNHNTPIIMIEN